MTDRKEIEEYRALRRKKRKKRVIKRIFVAITTVIITIGLVIGTVEFCKLFFPQIYDEGYVPTPFGKNISQKVQKAQSLSIPDWIEKDIISVHTTARTGKQLTDIKNIVIHYVGNPNSTAKNNRDYFNKSTTTVSSHFVVGLDGEIIQCLPLWEKSAASNNRNIDTISIETCHPDESGKFSNRTYTSVIKLCVWLCENLGLDENDIIRHYDITEKLCPKYYVENPNEWEKLKLDVKEGLDSYEK